MRKCIEADGRLQNAGMSYIMFRPIHHLAQSERHQFSMGVLSVVCTNWQCQDPATLGCMALSIRPDPFHSYHVGLSQLFSSRRTHAQSSHNHRPLREPFPSAGTVIGAVTVTELTPTTSAPLPPPPPSEAIRSVSASMRAWGRARCVISLLPQTRTEGFRMKIWSMSSSVRFEVSG